ncbi:MAG: hypothetical protein WAN87_02710 [Thermoplasmata archaeon]
MTTSPTTVVYEARPSRPLGVAILAVLIGIYGFVVFLLGLFLAVGSSIGVQYGGGNLFGHFGFSGVLGGLIVLIVGLIILGLAVGLWHLRMWALVLTLIFLIFEMVSYGLAGAFITFGFIVALLLAIYLIAVSRHFR